MMRSLITALTLALLTAASLAEGEAPQESLTIPQFESRLQQLTTQVDDLTYHPSNAEAVRKSLPKSWTVTGGKQPVEVKLDFLDKALTKFQKEGPEPKKVTLRELHTLLTVMRTGTSGFLSPEATNAAMRKRLDNILAAREFNRVHGPSVFDIWMDKVRAWLEKWLSKLDISPRGVTWAGRIFVWLVIAAAASVLGVWLYRIYRRRPQQAPREIVPFAPSAKSWRLWLAEAREQAARGEWREAIHLSYWAGVSYLEVSGLWVPDRARTPREYLRAMAGHDPKKQPFTALTRRFESVWYGSRQARPDDFDAALAELEKLGCQ
jgi:hypothetical protein